MDGGLQAPTLPFFASSSNVNTCIVISSIAGLVLSYIMHRDDSRERICAGNVLFQQFRN